MKPISIRQKAIQFRKKGYSYNMISERLGLAKSTLSDWLREIPYKPNNQVIERIGFGKLKSAQFKHRARIFEIKGIKKQAKIEIGKISKRDLWFTGIGLYLGEGSKLNENIRLINSDPAIIKLAIKWFRQVCGLKVRNFVPSVHLYPDNNVEETLNYWSRTIGISSDQFGKTQIDKRANKSKKKKNKLPYGTLHLQIKSCGDRRFGRVLHRKIIGWIEAVMCQI